jgi:hypothetical protein
MFNLNRIDKMETLGVSARTESSQTDQINKFFQDYMKGELKKKSVQKWLRSLPAEKREDAQHELECAISTALEDL